MIPGAHKRKNILCIRQIVEAINVWNLSVLKMVPFQRSLAAEDESSSTVTSQSKEIELIKELYEENSDSLLIELKKVPDQQLGMGIGKRTRGILVTSLQPGSVAAEKLRVGDRLMAVNGLPVTDQVTAWLD